MGKKDQPSAEKKFQAALSMIRREEPGSKIARRYSVSETSLSRWRDAFLVAGKAAMNGKQARSEGQEIRELKKEIEERDRVIGEITIANRILKKNQDSLL